jgi:small GTP-binding protein
MPAKKSKIKIVMLGEGRVGKTSLLTRFLTNTFDENQESTLEAKMHSNVKMEVSGAVWDVALWDTAGQERFRALGPIYYRDADGAVLTYDITDKDSFSRVRVWLRELQQVVGDGISIIVVGNKCDLERERKVSKKEADDWCSEHNAQHVLASAKLNIRVTDAYQQLVAKIVASRGGGAPAGAGGASGAGAGGGGVGGDITFGRAPRPTGVRVTLDEEPKSLYSGVDSSGNSAAGGGGGSKCPC